MSPTGLSSGSKKVQDVHPHVKADEADHHLARSLRVGVSEMRRLALKYQYMKPNPGELELVPLGGGSTQAATTQTYTAYQLRVERSSMTNVWADTIREVARLPFRARIDLEGWDEALQGTFARDDAGRLVEAERGWVADLDGQGSSLDEWASARFEDSLFEGIAFGFVDNDPRAFPDAASRRLAGARPYVTKLCRCDFRWMIVETAEHRPRLRAVCFAQPRRSQGLKDDGGWEDAEVDALKVVVAGDPAAQKGSPDRKVRTKVYVANKAGDYVEDPEQAGEITPENPRDELLDIPLVPLYSQRKGPWRGESPFRDSAWVQVSIWNATSEWLNKVRETSLSWLHESGVDVEQPASGGDAQPVVQDTRSMRYRRSSQPDAKLTIVEASGEALEAIAASIDRMISWVERAHHQVSSQRQTSAVTAREITLEGVHASSALEMWVIFHEAAWYRVLSLMSLLGGLEARGSVSIPHDFGLPSAGMERNRELYVAGKMAATNYFQEALRAGDVDERGFDLRAERERERWSRVEGATRLVAMGVPPWDAVRFFRLDEAEASSGEDPQPFVLTPWEGSDVPLASGQLTALAELVSRGEL